MWQTSGSGEYTAGLGHSAIARRLHRPSDGRPGVFFHTGVTNDPQSYLTSAASGSQVTVPVARTIGPVISFSLLDSERYGNATNSTRIGQLRSFMQTRVGIASGKLYGIGTSKGALGLLNYARANPGVFAALALFVPAVDPQELYDRNPSGLQAEIAACYGGGRPPDSANPSKNTGELAGLRMKCWYSGDDPIIAVASVADFAQATGAAVESMGAIGHSAAGADPASVVRFLASA